MGASFDKKEFKRNVAGNVAYAPLFTVVTDIVGSRMLVAKGEAMIFCGKCLISRKR